MNERQLIAGGTGRLLVREEVGPGGHRDRLRLDAAADVDALAPVHGRLRDVQVGEVHVGPNRGPVVHAYVAVRPRGRTATVRAAGRDEERLRVAVLPVEVKVALQVDRVDFDEAMI